jgi:hypothetical protein
MGSTSTIILKESPYDNTVGLSHDGKLTIVIVVFFFNMDSWSSSYGNWYSCVAIRKHALTT